METIRIYHSPWRILLLALASLAFAVAGFFMAIHSPKGFHIVVGWISVVFFGLGGLYMLYGTLKERLTGKPFLTITDEAVIMGWDEAGGHPLCRRQIVQCGENGKAGIRCRPLQARR